MPCAVKRVPLRLEGDRRRAAEEAHLQRLACGHRHVVCLLGASEDDDGRGGREARLLLAFAGRRTLLDYVEQEAALDVRWAALVGVASAVAHVHASGVAHLDVKADNVMVDARGVPRLGDFGLSLPADRLLREPRGTRSYLAPEAFEECYDGRRADAWSLAVLAIAVAFRNLPFEEASRRCAAFRQYRAARDRGEGAILALRRAYAPRGFHPDAWPPRLAAVADEGLVCIPTARATAERLFALAR